mmetsp:Transcript_30495/g.64240  ORF Transcript_30495/g.64240 Transcript_30495/m.64240 type:complete len:185 (-) Transcript_30495:1124-1678(-)
MEDMQLMAKDDGVLIGNMTAIAENYGSLTNAINAALNLVADADPAKLMQKVKNDLADLEQEMDTKILTAAQVMGEHGAQSSRNLENRLAVLEEKLAAFEQANDDVFSQQSNFSDVLASVLGNNLRVSSRSLAFAPPSLHAGSTEVSSGSPTIPTGRERKFGLQYCGWNGRRSTSHPRPNLLPPA